MSLLPLNRERSVEPFTTSPCSSRDDERRELIDQLAAPGVGECCNPTDVVEGAVLVIQTKEK